MTPEQRALLHIFRLDEASGHELTVEHAHLAVGLAQQALVDAGIDPWAPPNILAAPNPPSKENPVPENPCSSGSASLNDQVASEVAALEKDDRDRVEMFAQVFRAGRHEGANFRRAC